jgi:magnesium-protoporphyrin IX monomethyl ester (oxidative) cyclase
MPRDRMVSIITSRSCPFDCSICCVRTISGPRWRARKSEKVVEELCSLVAEMNVDTFLFEDDNLNADRRRLIRICQGIVDSGLRIRWATPNGVHIGTLDEEVLTYMRKAGCTWLSLPIESGDDHMRNQVMGKRVSREHIFTMCGTAKRLGLHVTGFFIIGMPGETEASILATTTMIRALHLDNICVSFATPFPGSALFEQCVRRGYIDRSVYLNELNAGTKRPFDYPSFETEGFAFTTLQRWQSMIWHAFNEARPTSQGSGAGGDGS